MMGIMEFLALVVSSSGNERLRGLRGCGDGPQIPRMDPRSWEWTLDPRDGP